MLSRPAIGLLNAVWLGSRSSLLGSLHALPCLALPCLPVRSTAGSWQLQPGVLELSCSCIRLAIRTAEDQPYACIRCRTYSQASKQQAASLPAGLPADQKDKIDAQDTRIRHATQSNADRATQRNATQHPGSSANTTQARPLHLLPTHNS